MDFNDIEFWCRYILSADARFFFGIVKFSFFVFGLCHFTVKCVATCISVTDEWILLKLGILRVQYSQIVPILSEFQNLHFNRNNSHFSCSDCHFTIEYVASRISVIIEQILFKLDTLIDQCQQILPFFSEFQNYHFQGKISGFSNKKWHLLSLDSAISMSNVWPTVSQQLLYGFC